MTDYTLTLTPEEAEETLYALRSFRVAIGRAYKRTARDKSMRPSERAMTLAKYDERASHVLRACDKLTRSE